MSDTCCRRCGSDELCCASCTEARLSEKNSELAVLQERLVQEVENRSFDNAGHAQTLREHRDLTNAAYGERNRCVAAMTCMAMTRGWLTWLGKHEPANDPTWDKEWLNVVFIDLPTGQVSWHIHDRDLPLFAHLPVRPDGPPVEGDITKWDGHSTEEKYKRLERLAEPIRRFPWLYRP